MATALLNPELKVSPFAAFVDEQLDVLGVEFILGLGFQCSVDLLRELAVVVAAALTKDASAVA